MRKVSQLVPPGVAMIDLQTFGDESGHEGLAFGSFSSGLIL